MNLKEAFRYQNKLQSFMDEAQEILDRDSNVTKVENTYLRHKVMAEAEDETIVITPDTEYYEQITGIAQFLLYLLGEKEASLQSERQRMRWTSTWTARSASMPPDSQLPALLSG